MNRYEFSQSTHVDKHTYIYEDIYIGQKWIEKQVHPDIMGRIRNKEIITIKGLETKLNTPCITTEEEYNVWHHAHVFKENYEPL